MLEMPPARLPGRRVAVQVRAAGGRVGAPPREHRPHRLGHGRVGRPGHHLLLGPGQLGRLGQQHRGAVGHQEVGRPPERRVRGHGAEAVRAAALDAQDEVAGRHLLPLHRGHPFGDAERSRHPGIDRGAGATGVLDDDRLEGGPGRQPGGVEERVQLVDFATKSDDHGTGGVRVGGVAGQHAAQAVDLGAVRGQPAAAGVQEGGHPVDPLRQEPARLGGHRPRHRGRAVHGGDDEEVVAGADATVGPHVAPDRAPRGRARRGPEPSGPQPVARCPSS